MSDLYIVDKDAGKKKNIAFFWTKTYVVGTQMSRLHETFLSTQNMF